MSLFRDGVLQLSSTQHTRIDECQPAANRFHSIIRPLKDLDRTSTPLSAIESPNFSPAFNELDTCGVVVLIKLPEQTSGNTVVYISDLNDHYLSITFWASLSVRRFLCLRYVSKVVCNIAIKKCVTRII